MKNLNKTKVKFFSETLGLSPIKKRLKQSLIIFRGEEDVPKVQFGLSSLGQLKPKIAIPLWMGKEKVKNKVIISNLFNHTQTPIAEGWSVKKSQVKDFRGKKLTYNSHNGTDFAIPINSTLLTAAAGKVVLIKSEFNRGGLKIVIDHGYGLFTCSVHLAKALVMITFPFGIPHVHFNTWHNSLPVDPFPSKNQTSLWRGGISPVPILKDDLKSQDNLTVQSTQFSIEKIDEVISNCKTKKTKEYLLSIDDFYQRGVETMFEMNYYPTRFKKIINIISKDFSRTAILDLPFYAENFNGIVFIDEI
jgi:hypothetical protein